MPAWMRLVEMLVVWPRLPADMLWFWKGKIHLPNPNLQNRSHTFLLLKLPLITATTPSLRHSFALVHTHRSQTRKLEQLPLIVATILGIRSFICVHIYMHPHSHSFTQIERRLEQLPLIVATTLDAKLDEFRAEVAAIFSYQLNKARGGNGM